ncbi:MAG TPA: class I SAM-dependent methyltransferase [Methylomirabilota bacterium]|nr:class I SAM-dependent methyltransferase [Methylomirabilota bacterium]
MAYEWLKRLFSPFGSSPLEQGLNQRVGLLQLNAEELDFAAESFDVVVGAAVLHPVPRQNASGIRTHPETGRSRHLF